MILPILLFGATDCDDTARVRQCLRRLGVPFREINIDHNPEAEQFVLFINGGYRSTPTLVIGEGRFKTVITEPTDEELSQILSERGTK